MAYDYALFEVLPRRAVAAAGILALHVLVAYLLLTGLIHTSLPVVEPALVGTVRIKDRPQPTPPPLEPLELTRTTVATPQVPPLPDPPPAASQSPADTESEVRSGAQTDAVPLPQVRMLGTNQLPDAEEFYPPELRRLGVEGATYVRVCVDRAGVRQGGSTHRAVIG
jgi:outer membrane biosynthesis protein TonB